MENIEIDWFRTLRIDMRIQDQHLKQGLTHSTKSINCYYHMTLGMLLNLSYYPHLPRVRV